MYAFNSQINPYSEEELEIPFPDYPSNPTSQQKAQLNAAVMAITGAMTHYFNAYNASQALRARISIIQEYFASQLLTLYLRRTSKAERLGGVPLEFSIDRFTAAGGVGGTIALTHYNWLVRLQSSGFVQAENNALDRYTRAVCKNVKLFFNREFIHHFQSHHNHLFSR